MSDNYTVYKHISPEGKIYIGCTSVDLDRRFQSGYYHNSRFSDDINKFGWKNFKHEIIAAGLNKQDAFSLEKELIHKYDSTDPNYGYNLSSGGYGRTGIRFSHTEEARQKIRESSLGRHHTDETKRKLSEARRGKGNPMYNKHPSEETLRKLSEARRGENHPFYGKHRSVNTKKRRVICIETNKIYDSICKASADTGWSVSYISSVCSGKRSSTGPYHWCYVD